MHNVADHGDQRSSQIEGTLHDADTFANRGKDSKPSPAVVGGTARERGVTVFFGVVALILRSRPRPLDRPPSQMSRDHDRATEAAAGKTPGRA